MDLKTARAIIALDAELTFDAPPTGMSNREEAAIVSLAFQACQACRNARRATTVEECLRAAEEAGGGTLSPGSRTTALRWLKVAFGEEQ